MTSLAPERIMGTTAVDQAGEKIGKVGQVYLDDQTGEPTWVTLSTGLFGTKESFAPLQGAQYDGDNLVLAVTKDQVKNAPNIDDDGHIDETQQAEISRYYAGLLGSTGTSDYATGTTTGTTGTGTTDTGTTDTGYLDTETRGSQTGEAAYAGQTDESGYPGAVGHDTSGPTTDNAMTRSEEQMQVGTQQVETGRARLRKYIVTENVTQTVPVSREEIRVEREPITEGNVGQALDGPELSEEEHEVTLHAERPVVAKETVPVERVRLDTETVTEQAQVDETLRKEQIEVDGDGTNRNL
jgi:uncharacterized protein (TIGR02271 family)